MANYKGHIAGGVLANTAFVALVYIAPGNSLSSTAGLLSNWQFVAGLYVVSILFGLWPDVDTNSKGQDIFFGLAFIINIFLIASGRIEASAYLGLLAMTPIIGKHRGWTHSKIAMIWCRFQLCLFLTSIEMKYFLLLYSSMVPLYQAISVIYYLTD
jgi:hypothetical protein